MERPGGFNFTIMDSKVNIFGYDFVKVGSCWLRPGTHRSKFDVVESIRKLVYASGYRPPIFSRPFPPIVENYRDVDFHLLINLLNNLIEVLSTGFIPTSDYVLANNGFVHKDVYSPTDLSRTLRRVEYYNREGNCVHVSVSTIGLAIERSYYWISNGGHVVIY